METLHKGMATTTTFMGQLGARLTATEGQVDALQKEVATMTLGGERVKAAEESVAALQTSHQALAEELLAGQQAFREELQAKLCEPRMEVGESKEPTKSRLEPTAPEFIPSRVVPLDTGVVDGGTHSEGGHGAVQRPPLYDGRSAWEAHITQFEILAQLSNWSEAQRATYLAVSLRGSALAVLSNLTEERHSNHKSLVTALQNCFGTAHQAELHRMKLRNRTRKRDESLPELMEDIERLVRLAYPEAAPAMLEVLAKDHFVEALSDEDMRLRIRQSRPETLLRVLETALELESYQQGTFEARSSSAARWWVREVSS